MERKTRRKALALLLTALMAAQQGAFVSGAFAADVVVPQQTGRQTDVKVGPAAGAIGSVSPVSLNNLGLQSAPGLTSALGKGVGVQPTVAPSLSVAAGVVGPEAVVQAAVSRAPAALPAAVIPAAKVKPARAALTEAPAAGQKTTFVPDAGPGRMVGEGTGGADVAGKEIDLNSADQVRRTVERFVLRAADLDQATFEAKQDDGPDVGWKDVPPIPAEAPRSVAEIDLTVPAGARYTPSPKNWASEIIYSTILDRFGRSGDYKTWGDPKAANTRHGGNIRGLIEKLDYIQGAGVSTILVNPLYMSPPAAYHNYWPLHFMAVDPNLGTLADFQELVAKAHQRGMRVVLDMVFNHTAPVIDYEGGWKFGHEPKKIKGWKYPLEPVELRDENNYHRRGSIDDWHNEEQIKYGDFPGGLNHLATERPETQDILLKVAKWWMKQTDVDGFRLDTYMHVAPSFWTRFFQETRDYAHKLGKDNFLLLGEIYHGDPYAIVPEVSQGRLGAAFNYPGYFSDEGALHGQGPTRWLENSFNTIRAAFGQAMGKLVRFIDNQDKPRFLRPGDPVGILKVAMAYTLLSAGIPFVYYGTEQAFRRIQADYGMDGYREDMFPGGQFRSPDSKGDDFNTESPLYRHLSELAAVRKANPALSLGDQYIRWSDPNGPGVFAFSRIHEGSEVVVVLNTAGEARSAEMWVDANLTPAGTELVDEMDPGYKVAAHAPAEGGAKVMVSIPAHGVRVLTRRARPQ